MESCRPECAPRYVGWIARDMDLAGFSTARGDLVRVYSQSPKLAGLEFAVELALYGMFCIPIARALPGHPLSPPHYQ
jgi:hypothetical protein